MKTRFNLFIICFYFISTLVRGSSSDNNKASEKTDLPIKKTSKSLSPPSISVSNNFVVKMTSSRKAVVVKSWNSTESALIWPHINAYWWKYGNTEVTIDDSSLIDVQSFTLQDLINSGADVIILSNPAGANKQYTQSEIQAVTDYCYAFHNLLGTHEVFQSSLCDNRSLARLFSFEETIQYYSTEVSPIYYYQNSTTYLFNNMIEPYISNGYAYSQVPGMGNWITSGVRYAEVVGLTQDTSAIITQYHTGAFWSVYISSMPEYFGDSLDAQFLYNAITFHGQTIGINEDEKAILDIYYLEQNFPNPFNPLTNIKYRLLQTSNVNLSIFNQLGEKIKTLLNGKQSAGNYQVQWNGTNYEGSQVSSGIYYYRLKAGIYIQTRKMLLVR
jgi:hypothetical protein